LATATRSPLAEQAEKLARLAQFLRDGRLLEQVLRLAQSGEVWSGPIHDAFLGWMQHAMDFWVRNQLAEGVRLVAKSLADRVAAIEQAQAAMAAGQIGVVGPAAPTPLNYVPGAPPPYGQIGGGPNNQFKTDGMRRLSQLLGQTADQAVIDFNRKLRDALVPPPMPPPPPGAPPPISPLPPDAEAVVGNPNTLGPGNVYLAIAQELRNAAADIDKRADTLRLLEAPMETATIDLGGITATAGAAGAAVQSSTDALTGAQAPIPDTATTPEKPPPTQEEIDRAKAEGEDLAKQALKDEVLDDPEELKEVAKELEKHKDDPAYETYCAAFVKRFGPENTVRVSRTLQAWQYGWEGGAHQVTPPERNLPYGKADKKPSDQDIEGVLYSFSATLATASRYDGDPNIDKELDQIADTNDPLALSWLLTNHDAEFDADFLVKAFDNGVKDVIKHEALISGVPVMATVAPLRLTGGTKLSADPKVAVLNAISRNEEAAMRLQTEFKPFTLEFGGGHEDVKIDSLAELLYQGGATDKGYSDNGSSLGRMLDTSHRGLCELGATDPAKAEEAKRMVDQIVDSATKDKEVKRAQEALREIGARQPVTDEDAQTALAKVKKNENHPAREALLAMTAQRTEVAGQFVADASKAKGDKEVLNETRAGWDIVRHAMTAQDASEKQRDDAERTLEGAMKNIADGQELTGEARRGMAESLALRFGDLAYALYSPIAAPEHGWVNASKTDVAATMAEVARDKEARETLMVGVGAWSSKTYSEMAGMLATGAGNGEVMAKFAPEMVQMGKAFCQVVTAVQEAGVKERDEAMALLQRYRFGVDVVFDLVEMIPAVGAAKGAVDKGLGYLPGDVAPDYNEAIRSGIAQELSGVDMGAVIARTKEEAQSTMSQVDVMVLENMMSAMGREPGLMAQMGLNTWSTWPQSMLKEPLPPSDVPVDSANLAAYVKPEFLDSAGGVRFPVPGTQGYEDFQRWYMDPSLDNPLLEQATFITAEVRNSMNTCMFKTQWEKSL
jgi:hypothetical protein